VGVQIVHGRDRVEEEVERPCVWRISLERVAAQDQLLNAELLLTSEEYELKVFYLSAYRAVGAITAGTSGRELPPTPSRRPVPESPLVTLPQ
jgi:hypothetical protein